MISPAEHVILVFGGVRKTARAVGRTPGSVSKWLKSGVVPVRSQLVILRIAKRRKLDIFASDLIIGR